MLFSQVNFFICLEPHTENGKRMVQEGELVDRQSAQPVFRPMLVSDKKTLARMGEKQWQLISKREGSWKDVQPLMSQHDAMVYKYAWPHSYISYIWHEGCRLNTAARVLVGNAHGSFCVSI